MQSQSIQNTHPLRIAALVSAHGRGSNLQALIDACHSGFIPGEISLVIGTRADSPAMERASAGGAVTKVISPSRFAKDDVAYGNAILAALESHDIGLVCLAGYMRILPQGVVSAYLGKVMNIHPGLLPFFGGQGMYGERVHAAVIESGMKVSGCTVHFVDEHYDTGPIIHQRTVSVYDTDTPESLAARVLEEEHHAYPEAVRLFAQGRLSVEGHIVRVLPENK